MGSEISQLVAIDVRPGSISDSLSGLNLLHPKVYGRLEDRDCGKDVAFLLIHPSSNFHGHYLLEPLRRRGRAVMALNTRFAGNDSALIMERCIQDLGAGVAFLRGQGYRRVVLIGNSGGGSLAAFYQAEAEDFTVATLPDGRPSGVSPSDLPPVDALALVAAHPGRAQVLTNWLDPSVIDETDQFAVDPELDMFDLRHGPPYDRGWLAAYRAAQVARNRRLTERALARLRAYEANPDPELPKDGAFIVYRTAADPRFTDLTLDPNDRVAGAARGSARMSNYGAINMGRLCSYRSWLSQWSIDLSRADGPKCLARTRLPVLTVNYTADGLIFPSDYADWEKAAAGRCTSHALKGGTHHLQGQDDLIAELADLLVDWAGGLR